jgi:hypothetical protein
MVESAVGRLFAALLVACGVVACGAEPAADSPTPTGTTTSVPAPTTTTTTVTTTTTTTTAAPFAGADGRNLEACADGTCEVFVQTGDSLPNASGTGPVQITVEGGLVSLAQTDASGFSSTLSGRPGSTQQLGNQVIDIVVVDGAQAALRLSLV